jgi:hypothetical protein
MWVDSPITRTVTMHGIQIPVSPAAPPPAPAPPMLSLPPPPPRGVPTIWLILAGAGVVVLALFLFLRGGNPNEEALSIYTEARAQCEAGRFEACGRTLEGAVPLAQDPTTRKLIEELRREALVAPRVEAGTVALEAGRLDDAEGILREALGTAPENARVQKLAEKLALARAAAAPPPAAAPAQPADAVPVPVPVIPPVAAVVPLPPSMEPDEAAVARTASRYTARYTGRRPNDRTTTPPSAPVTVAAAAPTPPVAAPTEAPRPRAMVALLDPRSAPQPTSASAGPRPVISALGPAPAAGDPEPAAAGGDTGFVSVTSATAGTVFIDGESTRKLTPLWMYKVKAGSRRVEVRDATGKILGSKTVEVKPKVVAPVVLSGK